MIIGLHVREVWGDDLKKVKEEHINAFSQSSVHLKSIKRKKNTILPINTHMLIK